MFYLLPANAGPVIAQARGENLRWFPPNLTQAENSAGAIPGCKRIFASFPRSENNDENRWILSPKMEAKMLQIWKSRLPDPSWEVSVTEMEKVSENC